jgi:hypothetical protein
LGVQHSDNRGAYAVSLLIIERLFRAVKPKLMTLGWFASLWNSVVALPRKLERLSG